MKPSIYHKKLPAGAARALWRTLHPERAVLEPLAQGCQWATLAQPPQCDWAARAASTPKCHPVPRRRPQHKAIGGTIPPSPAWQSRPSLPREGLSPSLSWGHHAGARSPTGSSQLVSSCPLPSVTTHDWAKHGWNDMGAPRHAANPSSREEEEQKGGR